MTFLEAAIAILQREGKPLHFKQLTEIALKSNLLTVVGRTPELTMQQRLNDALKKNDASLILTREKPGVFGLRHYGRPAGKAEEVAAPARVEPPVAEAAPAAKAARTEPDEGGAASEERRRGRRRGGRGRGRKSGAETAGENLEGEGSAGAEAGDKRDDIAATDGAAARPVAAATPGTETSPAQGSMQVTPQAAPHSQVASRPDEAAAVARPPSAGEESGEKAAEKAGDGAEDKAAKKDRPAIVAAVPERRTFAEAAAVVQAAHRRRAEHGAPEGAAPTTHAEPAPARAHDTTPSVEAQHPTVAEEIAPPDAEPAPIDAFENEDIDTPTGPMIAPAYGTEELVRGEDHRNVYDPRLRRRGREPQGRGREQGGAQGQGRADQPGRQAHAGREQQPNREQPSREQPAREAGAGHAREHRPSPAPNQPHGDRGYRDRDQRGRDRGPSHETPRPSEPERRTEPHATTPPISAVSSTSAFAPTPGASGTRDNTIDAVVEILRTQEGRNVHVRQIVEMALKRKLLRGEAAELVRLVRGAIVADAREREAMGLRLRVRPAGGSNYFLDRRLESELYQLEREIAERTQRLMEITRGVLLRRVTRMSAPAFEALMRLLLARLGVTSVELVKRGEGVAYFGGERRLNGARRRVLIAMRPSEAEVTARAVGELRAGLKVRAFDEGILFSAGRANPDALASLGAIGGPMSIHDGDELAALCMRNSVGTTRRALSLDLLDVELLSEIQQDA